MEQELAVPVLVRANVSVLTLKALCTRDAVKFFGCKQAMNAALIGK